MHASDRSEPPSTPELAEARQEVALAKLELQDSLHEMRDSGQRALVQMVRKARPVLIAAAVVLAVVVVARRVRTRRTRKQKRPRGPSTVGILVRAAIRGATRALAVRAAEEAAARFVLSAGGGEREAEALEDPGEWHDASTDSSDSVVRVGLAPGLTTCVSTVASK
jgi:hypothetical protein